MANFLTLHNIVNTAANRYQPSNSGSANAAVNSVAVPISVRSSVSQSTVNPTLIYMRNPVFGGWALGRPQPRSSFSLPILISPAATPTDQTLFEEPQNAAKKHYLPQYGIATRGSGGSMVKWVSFAPSALGFVLTVHLADVTSPSLSTNNTPIAPNTTRYLLTANLQGRAASWDFDTATTDAGALVLTLTVKDLGNRNSIYHAMTDATAQAQLIIRRSVDVAALVPPAPSAAPTTPPPQPVYRESLTAIDSSIPFTFDLELDKNVFVQLTGMSSGQGTLNIQQVSWQGRPFPYYQDPNQPAQVYYLPDAFKISRQPAIPHAPNILVSTNGSDPNSLTFTISFLAVPVWDPNRLTAAATALQNIFLLDSPPSLALLEATNTALALTLPPSDASSAPGLAPQPGANIDIAAGIKCSITLSLPQFQQVYAALFDSISQLLSGVVTVTVDSDVRRVPFISSAADFAGDIFDKTNSFDPIKNQFVVALQNAIESPIHVDALPAVLMKADQPIPNIVQQLSPSLPIDLAPPGAPASASSAAAASGTAAGSSGPQGAASGSGSAPANGLTVSLQLAAGQSVDQTCSVLFDFSHTHVVPDPDAIWEAIMQNQVVGPVKRNVKIMVFASIFTQPAPTTAAGTSSNSGTGSSSTSASGSGAGSSSASGSGSSGDSSSTNSSAPSASSPTASGGDAAQPSSSGGQAPSGMTDTSGSAPPAGSTAPSSPSATLMAVQVVFADGQTANFDLSTPANAGIMTQTVSLGVPVKMYVLQVGDAANYKYRVNLITSAGTRQGDWISSNQDSFYVQVND